LSSEIFDTLVEPRYLIDRWWRFSNDQRIQRALAKMTPPAFAQACCAHLRCGSAAQATGDHRSRTFRKGGTMRATGLISQGKRQDDPDGVHESVPLVWLVQSMVFTVDSGRGTSSISSPSPSALVQNKNARRSASVCSQSGVS
jgi:hypothetical protein